MEQPIHHCDIVMKGGVTSGVVYPRAIVELSRKYRFRNIGGTSAGAIAAVVTAAAEYGRDTGGFKFVAQLPETLAGTLLDKFQPYPKLKPLFTILLASISGSRGKLLSALFGQYWAAALSWAAPGIALGIVWFWIERSAAAAVLGLMLAAIGYAVGIAIAILRQVRLDLPEADYGMCGGLTQPDSDGPALTVWLADLIDTVAGRDPLGPPLGVQDLKERGIAVKTVTTDLTTRRPYALPMDNNLHFFSETEFRRLFPKRVVDHMIINSSHVGVEGRDFYYFRSENMPLVLLVRMSLSFPGLISAVPLWRRDYTLTQVPEAEQYVRCLFSDGGLSSNFPVTFFDAFLPHRPTFGISLGDYDARRSLNRVSLPSAAGQGQLVPTRTFGGLAGLLGSLIDSAKDWQDTLQSALPGYRERIVTLSLREGEGGLNLEMEPHVILGLAELGKNAGTEILTEFDLDEHRWRRYLVEVRAIDEMLRQFAQSFDASPEPGSLTYADLAISYKPKSYTKSH